MDSSGAPIPARDYYGAIAPRYEKELADRKRYVSAIDDVVAEWIASRHTERIVDVGCGNGARLRGLVDRCGVAGVGLDVSPPMVAAARALGLTAHVVDISSSGITAERPEWAGQLVTSLWNVLGHIEAVERRRQAVVNMRGLLERGGILIVDVNNRYNAQAYGWPAALRNHARDSLGMRPSGDFVIERTIDGRRYATVTHVFSPREARELVVRSGFRIVEEHFVDYASGRRDRGAWTGQLCIVAEAC